MGVPAQNKFILAGIFFILDRTLKILALTLWSSPYFFMRWFGWNPFLNPGVAFGIALPNWLILSLTFPIILLFIFLFFHQCLPFSTKQAIFLILLGGISNFFDRWHYTHTIDYLQIGTAVINFADILIVVGVMLLLRHQKLTSLFS